MAEAPHHGGMHVKMEAAPQGDGVTFAEDKGGTAAHEEVVGEKGGGVRGDYSGATAKTDPAEKKLVRKLDLWIMVRFSGGRSLAPGLVADGDGTCPSRCSGSCTGSTTWIATPLRSRD